MNRTEGRLLRDATHAVAHHNKHLWWELKREVWEFGCQSFYPRESEYQQHAEIAVAALSEADFLELVAIYVSRHHGDPPPSNEQVVRYYASLMIGEIVRRARVAGNRTLDW